MKFKATSTPLLEIDPLFTKIFVKPVDGEILEFWSRSLVVLSYISIVPDTTSFKVLKSTPKFNCSVVSHVKEGFERVNNPIGILVVPPDQLLVSGSKIPAFPYKVPDKP